MVRLQIKLNQKSMLVWVSVLFITLIAFMAFFPSMSNDAMKELTNGKLSSLPPSILSVIGFETFPDFTNINVFYGYIMQYINMALAVYAMTLGLNWYLKEEREGTIEFLFSQPQSRYELMIGKLVGNVVLVTLVVTGLVLTSMLSFVLFKPSDVTVLTLINDNLPVFASYYFIAFIFLVLGSGLSMLLDASMSISGIAMGTVFLSYLIGIMASLVEVLKPLKHLSILHALMPHEVYAGTSSLLSIGMWVVLSLAVYGIGAHHFKRRDILV